MYLPVQDHQAAGHDHVAPEGPHSNICLHAGVFQITAEAAQRLITPISFALVCKAVSETLASASYFAIYKSLVHHATTAGVFETLAPCLVDQAVATTAPFAQEQRKGC